MADKADLEGQHPSMQETEHAQQCQRDTIEEYGATRDLIKADLLDDRYAQTQRGLNNRRVQMMVIGGAIGIGLFVSTGRSLAIGGPASLLIAYCLMSFLVYCIITAMAEVGSYMPVHGATMSYHGSRFVSRSLGFAMGYLYWYSLGILIPDEVTAAALVIDYWPNTVPLAGLITIILFVIIGLNFLPVKFYGESEFWFAITKVLTIIGLIILSFILFWGGGPNQNGILGFHYWETPGAFNVYIVKSNVKVGRFVGVVYCIVSSAFSFIFAPELVIITGGEMASPRRNIPRAAYRYIYRLILFYIIGILAITVTCPSNSSAIVSGASNAKASPFVVAIKNAGIPYLDSIVNGAILLSAWSNGNSWLFMSSRSLYSLAVAGHAPRVFKTCNQWGVPYPAVAASSLFSLLAYLSVGNSSSIVFTWLVNLTNTSGFISWICCSIISFRFRKAARAQGVEIPYRPKIQPFGAWFGLIGASTLLLINGFTVFFPPQWSVSAFFTAYIGIPAFLALYLGHRIVYWMDPWAWRPKDVDMQTGLDEVLTAEHPPLVRDTWRKKAMALLD